MNTRLQIPTARSVLLALSLSFILHPSSLAFAAPLGTAFTYQGRLNDGTNAANNLYDLDFALFAVPDGGSPLGMSVTYSGLPVSNGLFTVTLDFGASPFNGDARWLQIQVRTNGGRTPPPYTLLSPRQPLTPTPYALYAPSAGSAVTASNVAPFSITAGNIANGTITAGKLASGEVVKSLNGLFDAVTLSAGTNVTLTPSGNDLKISATPGTVVTNAGWGISGNSGTTAASFLGTTDGQPLELRVNGQRALRLEPGPFGSPNLVGGLALNSVAPGVFGATIAGGGSSLWGPNRIQADYGSIGGGCDNSIEANAPYSTIAGGILNNIQDSVYEATIGGGIGNTIQTIAGGSTIGGGEFNTIQPNAYAATIGGGGHNTIGTNANSSTIGGGSKHSIESNSTNSVIGGGLRNYIQYDAWDSTIGGGSDNTIEFGAPVATIAGGEHNFIEFGAWDSTIGGGSNNTIGYYGWSSTIGGGSGNRIGGYTSYATVPGGAKNVAGGHFSFAAGRRARTMYPGTFIWADATDADYASTGTNQFCVRATGGVQLSPVTSLYCGSQVRQMLNLWGTNYGIGVQASTLYFRTGGDSPGNGFAWYRGGGHNDGYTNNGGGATLMTLNNNGLTVNGTFVSSSDRNLKENFATVSPREVLEKVTALPISRWNFKADPGSRHVGPMAQDFHAAFALGADDRHIATVDADGVALAAIQGLNQKLEETRAELKRRDTENAELKARLERLEQLVSVRNGGGK